MSQKTDLQAEAASLGIVFDGKTTTAQLEKLIADKKAEAGGEDTTTPAVGEGEPVAPVVPPNHPAEAGTAPAATQAPDTPPEDAGDQGKGFAVTPNGQFQVVRSADGSAVRMFDKFGRAVSPVLPASDHGAVEQLNRDCSRHNAFAKQAK